MIKGVNRAVIEVNDTANPYIEKAILFVNAEYAQKSPLKDDQAIREYLGGLTLPSYCLPLTDRRAKATSGARRGTRWKRAAKALTLAALLLTAAFILMLILYR